MSTFRRSALSDCEIRNKNVLGSGGQFLTQTRSRSVLFVTNTGEFGGAEKHLLQLVRRLMLRGVRPSILCVAQDLYSEHLSEQEAQHVPIIRYEGSPDSFLDWLQVFRKSRPDIVVFVRAWLWCYRWHVPLAAWVARVPRRISIAHLEPRSEEARPKGVSIQNAIFWGRKAAYRCALRASNFFEQATICVSNSIRDRLVKEFRFPTSKTMTIHNGVSLGDLRLRPNDEIAVRRRLGLREEEFLLVCIARLSEQKRIDILLQAMAELVREGVPCKCVIVGDGPLRGQLVECHAALGLRGHVFFEGFQRETLQYLHAGTAFVLTSDWEGLPLALLEAMACGLPCIVTSVGGNVEVVTNGVHGLVVPPGSPHEVANAIRYLCAHPSERKEMASMARARALAEFDVEKWLTELGNIILG